MQSLFYSKEQCKEQEQEQDDISEISENEELFRSVMKDFKEQKEQKEEIRTEETIPVSTVKYMYKKLSNTLSNTWVQIRDRQLISDNKLIERSDKLGIKPHELVQLRTHKHLVITNYLTAITFISSVAIGSLYLYGSNSNSNSNPNRTISRPFTLRAYPSSNIQFK